MLRTNLPRSIRFLRRRRGWRQDDLAARAGTSRHVVSRVERGLLDGVPFRHVERLAAAVGATVDVTLRWEGERLDRLVDAAHAAVQEQVAALLDRHGWETAAEVSFNHYGDRGRVDVLAFHPPARCLVVVEVKSAIGDVQETLGRLDTKARLGVAIARDRGWTSVSATVPALVIADSRTSRRVVASHDALFRRFECRGRAALRWIRSPGTPVPSGLLWFVVLPDARGVSITRTSRIRAPLDHD